MLCLVFNCLRDLGISLDFVLFLFQKCFVLVALLRPVFLRKNLDLSLIGYPLYHVAKLAFVLLYSLHQKDWISVVDVVNQENYAQGYHLCFLSFLSHRLHSLLAKLKKDSVMGYLCCSEYCVMENVTDCEVTETQTGIWREIWNEIWI